MYEREHSHGICFSVHEKENFLGESSEHLSFGDTLKYDVVTRRFEVLVERKKNAHQCICYLEKINKRHALRIKFMTDEIFYQIVDI